MKRRIAAAVLAALMAGIMICGCSSNAAKEVKEPETAEQEPVTEQEPEEESAEPAEEPAAEEPAKYRRLWKRALRSRPKRNL